MPVSATWLTSPDRLQVTWDQALEPGSTSQANWIALHAASAWQGLSPGTIVGNTTTVPMISVGMVLGENCSYLAASPDVFGLVGGLPAASFIGFPLT